VLDVVPAGAGVIVRLSDGIVALDGHTGEERWHYRWRGGRTDALAASPSGDSAVVHFWRASRLLRFDAMTGKVGFDEIVDVREFHPLVVTDHILLTRETVENQPTTYQAYDLRTGKPAWAYTEPARCRHPGEYENNPTPARNTILFSYSFVCTPNLTLLALDDRTGKQRWRFERTPPTSADDADPIRDDFLAGNNGDSAWIGALYPYRSKGSERVPSYLLDTDTGKPIAQHRPGLKTAIDLNLHGLLAVDMRGAVQLLSLDGGLLGSTGPAWPTPEREPEQGQEQDRHVRATARSLIDLRCSNDRTRADVLPWNQDPDNELVLGDWDNCGLEIAPGAVVAWHYGGVVGLGQ
jgi:hypothetical protein